MSFYNDAEYEQALQTFLELDDYKDSLSMVQKCEEAILSQKRLRNATTISAGIRFSTCVTEENKVAFAGQAMLERR